jgi:hypothetical protein
MRNTRPKGIVRDLDPHTGEVNDGAACFAREGQVAGWITCAFCFDGCPTFSTFPI